MFFSDKNVTDKKFLESNPTWKAISSSTAIIEFSPNGDILGANSKFLNLTGYSLDEIVGQHHKMFCSHDFISSSEYAAFWRSLEGGQFESGTYPRYNKYGKRVWLEASYNPVIKNKKVVKVIKIASDVTEKIEISNSSKFLIDAIDRAMAIIEFSVDGKILKANNNFSKVMGYSENEIIGKHHRMFCERKLVDSHDYSNFWKELNRGVYQSGQFPRITKEGYKVWLEATYNPVFDDLGNITKIIKIAKDVTAIVDNRVSDEHNADDVYNLSQTVNNLSLKNKEVLTEASKKVENIKSMMEQSEDMMVELSKKVANINSLVEKVKDISHQTHLLSLNASIEAATAGVHGKGFGVVALEVKRLAGFTKEASEHISKVIESIKLDTKNAAEKIHCCSEQSNETNKASKQAQDGLAKIDLELSNLITCVKKFSTINKM